MFFLAWFWIFFSGVFRLIRILIDHQFEMNWTLPFFSIVRNVVCPCFAFDIYDYSTWNYVKNESINNLCVGHWIWTTKSKLTRWFRKMNGYQWTKISLWVLVWEIIAGESLAWIVFDLAHILDISRIFTFAWYPNSVQLQNKTKIFINNYLFSGQIFQMKCCRHWQFPCLPLVDQFR